MNNGNDPRYVGKPMLLLFEALVLDIMGYLPGDQRDAIEKLHLQRTFGTTASEWRAAIAEVLHVSPTFEIAVLDLWYRNSEIAEQRRIPYEPRAFAQDFVDRYMAPDSKIDVWTDDALIEARERIRNRRAERLDSGT